jgi:long-chain acyl-CoA synthetase
MHLVNDFLEQTATRLPNKVALICEGERYSYVELDHMANRLAHALQEHGVNRGDRVVIFLPNSVALVVAIFGVLKANAVFVVANSSMKSDKLLYMVNNCRAAALVASASKAPFISEIVNHAPSVKATVLTGTEMNNHDQAQHCILTYDAIQANYPSTCPARLNIDQDLACLIYTSGSTGDPKGVMSSHSNVVFATSSIISYLRNVEEDIVLNVLPLSFDYGLYQLLMTFRFGGALVLERSFAYPVQILKKMEQEQVTGLPGVPTIFSLLLQIDLSAYDLSHLRYITNTAAALPASHIRQIRNMFPHALLYSMYGLTETKRTLYMPPEQLDCRPDSVGIAIPGTEVWIEDETGQRLGTNQIGELVIRGSHVMRGYWESPIATAERFRPGPLGGERLCYSGDLFRMDADGYLYFIGRKDDIIKSRGEKVAPKEVENVLYQIPGIVETAVVGVEDSILGHALKAFIVASNGNLTAQSVLQHCRAHLEDYMIPKYVEFCDSLPKTSSGKIKKTELA